MRLKPFAYSPTQTGCDLAADHPVLGTGSRSGSAPIAGIPVFLRSVWLATVCALIATAGLADSNALLAGGILDRSDFRCGKTPDVPEPMVFDLVRGLGARQGELEVNTLAVFPIGGNRSNAVFGFDPFGFAPSSEDSNGIEWAPEIEYALRDGFAVEFELPFENSKLEAYKVALQWTFGTAFGGNYIDGAQVIIEPNTKFRIWELTALYLAGAELNERWSAMAMMGARTEIESGRGFEQVDGIVNYTLFRRISHRALFGVESNFTFGKKDRTTLLLIPQVDYNITDAWEVQFGGGVGFSRGESQPVLGMRLIYSR